MFAYYLAGCLNQHDTRKPPETSDKCLALCLSLFLSLFGLAGKSLEVSCGFSSLAEKIIWTLRDGDPPAEAAFLLAEARALGVDFFALLAASLAVSLSLLLCLSLDAAGLARDFVGLLGRLRRAKVPREL